MTHELKSILVFISAACLVFCVSSCDSEQPEQPVNRVVKRSVNTDEIPFNPWVVWKDPLRPLVEDNRLPIPEPYPDPVKVIEEAPPWDGHFFTFFQDSPETSVASSQSVESAAPAAKPYSILLGTFVKQVNAQKSVDDFTAKGLSVYLKRFTYKNRNYFGVFHGGYDNYRQAKRAGGELKKRGRIAEFYVRKIQDQP